MVNWTFHRYQISNLENTLISVGEGILFYRIRKVSKEAGYASYTYLFKGYAAAFGFLMLGFALILDELL